MRSLCSGADAGVDLDGLAHRRQQLVAVHLLQIRTPDRFGAGRHNVEFGGNGGGGDRMIAGDHDDADARALRGGDRLLRFRPRGIDDADDADKDQLVLQRLVGFIVMFFGDAAIGDAERAQRFAGQHLDGNEQLCAAFLTQGDDLISNPLVRTARQQNIGGAFGDNCHCLGVVDVGLHGAHKLAIGGKGDFVDALKAAIQLA